MKKLLQILNILAFGAMVYVNYLAVTLPIAGRSTKEVSEMYPNLFVPAGITFSIWSVIYLLLLGFVIYQAKDLFKSTPDHTPWFPKISIFFILSCGVNILWINLWHHLHIMYALATMAVFLILLIIIYTRLGIGRVAVSSTVKWLVHLPFSVYLGWITVATIANTTAYLVDIKWDGFGIQASSWAMIMIIIAAFIGQKVLSSRNDIGFGLVLIWAFVGIILKQKDGNQNVMIAASIAAGLVFLSMLPPLIRSMKKA